MHKMELACQDYQYAVHVEVWDHMAIFNRLSPRWNLAQMGSWNGLLPWCFNEMVYLIGFLSNLPPILSLPTLKPASAVPWFCGGGTP